MKKKKTKLYKCANTIKVNGPILLSLISIHLKLVIFYCQMKLIIATIRT